MGQQSDVVRAYGLQRQGASSNMSGLDTSSKAQSEMKGDSKLLPSAPSHGSYGAVSAFDLNINFFHTIPH